jgi:ferredoxin--NADP+ reductase
MQDLKDDGTEVELPAVESKLATPQAPAIARVVANEPCTYGKSNAWIRNVAVDVSGTKLAGAFHAGQAFGVLAPGTDERGKPHKVRLYSIASPESGEDGRGNVVCTPVKRVIDEYRNAPSDGSAADARQRRGMFMGVCSNYLCDLDVGEEVRITGPVGKRFLLPTHSEQHHHVFVATGTGIAPFRGMVLELLKGPAGNAGCEIWLLMGSPYTSDLLYHEFFLDLARQYRNFHYRQAISREPQADGSRGLYVDALIERELGRLGPLLADEHTVLYLCGLVGLQFNVFRRLAGLDLLAGYAREHKGELAADPSDWTLKDMRRALRPTERCMIEVY